MSWARGAGLPESWFVSGAGCFGTCYLHYSSAISLAKSIEELSICPHEMHLFQLHLQVPFACLYEAVVGLSDIPVLPRSSVSSRFGVSYCSVQPRLRCSRSAASDMRLPWLSAQLMLLSTPCRPHRRVLQIYRHRYGAALSHRASMAVLSATVARLVAQPSCFPSLQHC